MFAFLFLYSDLLPPAFHLEAIAELCRVATEVRIFPLMTLALKRSPDLVPVQTWAKAQGLKAEVVTVSYELQKGGNQMLRIW